MRTRKASETRQASCVLSFCTGATVGAWDGGRAAWLLTVRALALHENRINFRKSPSSRLASEATTECHFFGRRIHFAGTTRKKRRTEASEKGKAGNRRRLDSTRLSSSASREDFSQIRSPLSKSRSFSGAVFTWASPRLPFLVRSHHRPREWLPTKRLPTASTSLDLKQHI